MSILTDAYITSMLGDDGAARYAKIAPGGSAATYIAAADAKVVAAAKVAGYTIVATNAATDYPQAIEILKLAALWSWISVVQLSRDVIPEETLLAALIDPAKIEDGTYPLPGVTPDPIDAVGGGAIETTDPTTGETNTPVLSLGQLSTWR
jgi:hypothetical protein